MTIDFSTLAFALIAVFGIFGWIRGVRRVAVATGGVFFAMAVVDLMGSQFIAQLKKVGLNFNPATVSNLFLAVLFVFTVYMVQLFGVKMVLGSGAGPRSRQDHLNGLILGLVNGFLIVANTVRYANPYLLATQSAPGSGWSLHVLLPHFSHPDAGTFTVGIAPTILTITPSPLVNMYNTLPTAVVFLFAFLVFVFMGTLYGRIMRGRE